MAEDSQRFYWDSYDLNNDQADDSGGAAATNRDKTNNPTTSVDPNPSEYLALQHSTSGPRASGTG